MRATIAIGILLAVCLSTIASSSVDQCRECAEALPICAVLANAAKYDGKEITVRGLYRMVVHGSVLMGTACSQIEVNTREAAGYKADKRAVAVVRSLTKKNQFQPVDEILRGTFRVAQKEQCFGQICAPFEIEVSELLWASAPKDDSNGAGMRVAHP